MNILFIHRTFPAQFEHLLKELAKDPQNVVTFITNNCKSPEIDGVVKYVCEPEQKTSTNCHPHLEAFEEAVLLGQATAKLAMSLKQQGFKPDVIYGFSGWGSSMFIKDVFPDVPLLCYLEWYGKSDNSEGGSVFDFDGTVLNEDSKEAIRCNNSYILHNLTACDAGLTPTNWQKNLFPKDFHSKIKVIHDGIDTDICKPDNDVKICIGDKNIELSTKDEIITFGTRGLEPYRGFPEFMAAVEKLLKKRPNAHFIISGADVSCYSPQAKSGTYKELMLEKYEIDMNRVHFTGALSFEHYINVLQISSVHVYLTYPFVLSWSVLNAMAVGCCVIASNNEPTTEVIKNNYNGLLVDFFDVDGLVEKIEYALELKINDKNKLQEIRENARQTIVDNYALKDLLPQHIDYIKSLMGSLNLI